LRQDDLCEGVLEPDEVGDARVVPLLFGRFLWQQLHCKGKVAEVPEDLAAGQAEGSEEDADLGGDKGWRVAHERDERLDLLAQVGAALAVRCGAVGSACVERVVDGLLLLGERLCLLAALFALLEHAPERLHLGVQRKLHVAGNGQHKRVGEDGHQQPLQHACLCTRRRRGDKAERNPLPQPLSQAQLEAQEVVCRRCQQRRLERDVERLRLAQLERVGHLHQRPPELAHCVRQRRCASLEVLRDARHWVIGLGDPLCSAREGRLRLAL